jgi:hypothetical protein
MRSLLKLRARIVVVLTGESEETGSRIATVRGDWMTSPTGDLRRKRAKR